MVSEHVARRVRAEFALAAVMFAVAAVYAFLQRGYVAAGGEFGLLLLPPLVECCLWIREEG